MSPVDNAADSALKSQGVLRKILFQWQADTDGYTQSTLEEVLQSVQALEKQHALTSKTRKLGSRISPLVEFLRRYAPVVDIMVQYNPAPSALVWGAIRTVIEIARTSIRYYESISTVMEDLADIISISAQYETVFGEDPRVNQALESLYLELFAILQMIWKFFSRKSFRFIKFFVIPFEVSFGNNLARLSRRVKVYEQELELAHRKHAESHIRNQESAVRDTSKALDGIATLLRLGEKDVRKGIMKWLSAGDYRLSHHHASTKRTPGTCQWILKDVNFHEWETSSGGDANSSFLWVYGPPGTGKSVLCSTVIEHLQHQEDSVPTAYFYCDSRDRSMSSSTEIYSSLLSQVIASLPTIPCAVVNAYNTAQQHGRSRISFSDNITGLLKSALEIHPALNIVIDGLDECDEVTEVSSFLSFASQSLSSLKVLIFSRDNPTTCQAFKDFPFIQLDSTRNRKDIRTYLEAATDTLSFPLDLRHRALEMLSQRAGGMFLFAYLGIQTLRKSVNVQDILRTLQELPVGLDDFYALILSRLANQTSVRREAAQRIFLWMCGSVRSLSWTELQCALSWNPRNRIFDENLAPFKDAVLDLCSPLITYRTEADTFHLTHLSVREYLLDSPKASEKHPCAGYFSLTKNFCHAELSQVCLSYLRREEVSRSILQPTEKFPLARYATDNWAFHLSSATYDSDLNAEYQEFEGSPDRRCVWIARSLISEHWPFPLQRIVRLQNSLRSWASKSAAPARQQIDDLVDIQRALFALDEIQISPKDSELYAGIIISNFERLMILRDLAREYTRLGQIETGIRMFANELAKIDESSAVFSPSKPWLLNSLGILYDQQGQTERAEQIQRQALRYQEYHLPHDHLDTILTANELGRVCRHLSKLEEAESLHRRALDSLQSTFPSTDLHINWTIKALGRSLLRLGRPAEALELHTQALTTSIQSLGDDHPHTTWILSDLARCHRDLKNLTLAIATQQEVLNRCIKTLGLDHADTLWAKNSLGLLHEANNDISEATALQTEAYQAQVTFLGEFHPHTQWTRQILMRLRGGVSNSRVAEVF